MMNPRQPCFAIVAFAAFMSVAEAGSASADGRVVVIGDEWLLKDAAFDMLPEDTTALALNLAAFLAEAPGGGPGNILVYSSNFGLTDAQLANTMTTAGYGWTVDFATPFTVKNLLNYDAVYLAGLIGAFETNAAVLHDYVAAGGDVLILGGTANFSGGAAGEADAWAYFLDAYELHLGGLFFPTTTTIFLPLVADAHPIAQNVGNITWGFGQGASANNPGNPLTHTLYGDFSANAMGNVGVIAIFDPGNGKCCPGDLNGDTVVDGQDRAIFCAALGTAIGDRGFIAGADLNGDDVIDQLDQAMFNELVPVCFGDIVTTATLQPKPDGVTNGADLGFMLDAWGRGASCADFVTTSTLMPPPDGKVDGADLAVLLDAWGACQ